MKSIENIFINICNDAFNDAIKRRTLYGSSAGEEQSKPGYFYEKLPQEIKDRIKNELKSSDAQKMLYRHKLFGELETPKDLNIRIFKEINSKAKKEFEEKLMRNGWNPNPTF